MSFGRETISSRNGTDLSLPIYGALVTQLLPLATSYVFILKYDDLS